MTDIIIYHNPECGTSRNTLGLIRHAGLEPHVIEYLKTPPSRAMLKSLIARMGVPSATSSGSRARRIMSLVSIISPSPTTSCSMPCWHIHFDQPAHRGYI